MTLNLRKLLTSVVPHDRQEIRKEIQLQTPRGIDLRGGVQDFEELFPKEFQGFIFVISLGVA
jgi:hypothetical protein